MDSLDFNLHQSILSSLGVSFAREQQRKRDGKTRWNDDEDGDGDEQDIRNGTDDGIRTDSRSNGLNRARNGHSATNGKGGDILAAFGLSQDTVYSDTDYAFQGTNAAVALAEYVGALAVPSSKYGFASESFEAHGSDELVNESQSSSVTAPVLDESAVTAVLAILRRLPTLTCLKSFGVNGTTHRWLCADQLAFALANAAIRLANYTMQPAALDILMDTYSMLKEDLAHSDGFRIITHILPAINGIGRAFADCATLWHASLASSVLERLEPLSSTAAANVESVLRGSSAHSSSDGRIIFGVLARYDSLFMPFTPRMATFVDGRILRSIAVSLAVGRISTAEEGWTALVGGNVDTIKSHNVPRAISQSIEDASTNTIRFASSQIEAETDQDLGTSSLDPYEVQILINSMMALIAVSVGEHNANAAPASLLSEFLADPPTQDNVLTRATLTCWSALLHAFPSLAPMAVPAVRRFLTSPSLELVSPTGVAPSQTLQLASDVLASALDRIGQHDVTLSVVYSLLSCIPSTRGEQSTTGSLRSVALGNGPDDSYASVRTHNMSAKLTLEEKTQITLQALFAVTRLAVKNKSPDVIKLALSMVLQRIRTSTDPAIESAALSCCGDLATFATQDDYIDIVRVLCDVTKTGNLANDERLGNSISDAMLHLARSVAHIKGYAFILLRHLCALFLEQSSYYGRQSSRSTIDQTLLLSKLADTLSAIDALMTAHHAVDYMHNLESDLMSLLRNVWFTAIVLDLATPNRRETARHYKHLERLATKTPCLLRGTSNKYLSSELEYDPVLRRESGQSADGLRRDLATFIPKQGVLQSRILTYPQVVLLLTIGRLEAFRAAAGDPSEMLGYFDNDSVNSGPLAEPLREIADKATTAFLVNHGDRVRNQRADVNLSQRIKAVIVGCAHRSGNARSIAIRVLNDIFTAFPVLLCDAVLVTGLLELLTLLRDACEDECGNEYSPSIEFTSKRCGISLTLPDNYAIRNEILTQVYQNSRVWLLAALSASPLEMAGLLQNYLDDEPAMELSAGSGMGKSVALEIAKTMPRSAKEATFANYGGWKADTASLFASAFGTRHTFGSEAATVIEMSATGNISADAQHIKSLKANLRNVSKSLRTRATRLSLDDMRTLLYRTAAVIIAQKEINYDLVREIVFLPVHAINPPAMHLGVEVWAWLVDKRAEVEDKLMCDLYLAWGWTVRRRRGLFSVLLKAEDPIQSKTEYSPTDIAAIAKASRTVQSILLPQRYLLEFLTSRFQAFRYRKKYLVLGCMRMVLRTYHRCQMWGKHPLCRELRMKLLAFGFGILHNTNLEASLFKTLQKRLYAAAFDWFEQRPMWSYGSDRVQLSEDAKSIQLLIQAVKADDRQSTLDVSLHRRQLRSENDPTKRRLRLSQQLLLAHLEDELQRISIWMNPMEDSKKGPDAPAELLRSLSSATWSELVGVAWGWSPRLAVFMADRFKLSSVADEVKRYVFDHPSQSYKVAEALNIFLSACASSAAAGSRLKHLIYWAPESPIQILKLFLPSYNREPLALQCAMRSLEQHSVDLVFFYTPQVVQALRTDPLHYMERFIFETSKISQLFCHQMIWNMKANCFKDDLATIADPEKETFERMTDLIVSSLSGEAKVFYEKEFGFFNEVTSISRKLMPLVKKEKAEKKAKIDEEMQKINVEKGVYLPSHPEGTVVDIDRHSGRPLQSHAKTPFMATFYVEREAPSDYSEQAIKETGGEQAADAGTEREELPSLQGGEVSRKGNEMQRSKLAAIFKVGDDCRQDVLALQVIAQFKNMFNVLGLDLQVQPYKVLATGPGTGIIDVVPNATSRDEMGRAKINDLLSFFLFQYGPADSVKFQRARRNFIQSMAAYSVLCYILQIKDRHNGNIMIDGEGRITHIDFGFLFDIGPGGIKFEPNSFKLTHEMITLMGGRDSQGYRQFCELTVKAFLSCRAYVEDIVATCQLMMATDLPSFKGEGTMHRLRDRFRPDLSQREAARYMMGVIDNAAENSMSIIYDRFQYMQNKIPYAS